MKRIVVSLCVLAIASVCVLRLSGPAFAGCGPLKDAIDGLTTTFDEHLSSIGKITNGSGAIAMLSRSTDGSTWTILVVRPDMTACSLMSGTEWRGVDVPLFPPSEDY